MDFASRRSVREPAFTGTRCQCGGWVCRESCHASFQGVGIAHAGKLALRLKHVDCNACSVPWGRRNAVDESGQKIEVKGQSVDTGAADARGPQRAMAVDACGMRGGRGRLRGDELASARDLAVARRRADVPSRGLRALGRCSVYVRDIGASRADCLANMTAARGDAAMTPATASRSATASLTSGVESPSVSWSSVDRSRSRASRSRPCAIHRRPRLVDVRSSQDKAPS